jgi:GT2 family glycosyltransferase
MENYDLAIIIVSYNTEKITKNCLDSIYRSTKSSDLKYQIIIVDNNSLDNSVKMLQEYARKKDNMSLIINTENVGFGRANNQAVKIAKSKYILFLNSDIVVLENSINQLLSFYKKHYETHFLGGKLYNTDMTPQPSTAYFFTLPVVFAALFLKGDYWGLTRSSSNKFKQVDWIAGACILTQKKYFSSVGGFDENVFMYMEEVDLLYRAKLKGYNTYFYPDSKFVHLGFASTGSKSYPVIQVFKGLVYFYKKHFSKNKLLGLSVILKAKAVISLLIGRVTNNKYLIETYEKAYKLA